MSVIPLAPAMAQVRRSASTSRHATAGATAGAAASAAGAGGASIHRVAGHQASSHTNPSAPVTTNAARHP